MKTALYCKWQQSLSSFIEDTFIDLSVNSVWSTLEITEMYKTRSCPQEESFPSSGHLNLNWEIGTRSTSDYMAELGYIWKIQNYERKLQFIIHGNELKQQGLFVSGSQADSP